MCRPGAPQARPIYAPARNLRNLIQTKHIGQTFCALGRPMALTTKGATMCQRVRVFAAFALSSPSHRVVSSSPGMRWILLRAFICAFVALGLFTPTSRGAFITTITENGNDVVATGAGSLDLTDLTFSGQTGTIPFVIPDTAGLAMQLKFARKRPAMQGNAGGCKEMASEAVTSPGPSSSLR